MISVVLYGRNDSYGYNLHKRAVLSVNCIAEVLDDPDDEIIFVDYNTPDDLPTFPEAIGDMLTERARRLTRVLRVREAAHARFAGRTHLKALESPSRNAAVRRSNPRNRWVLSTNTDMVFVTRTGSSLSSVLGKLPDGFYHTARFELPEILWETLDRKDPAKCITSIARWGERLQLQEVVYGSPITLFDGPGDFQLVLREDVFRIDGFDERMLLGWHVDTNIARRLEILRGEPVKSALDDILAFHCDHNRETTPAHSHSAPQNDWTRFVIDVKTAGIPEQHDSWGLAGEQVEDFRLDDLTDAPSILERLLPPMSQPFYITSIEPQFFQDMRYDPEHVVPYVANVIGALPRHWNAAYAGCRKKMFAAFRSLWEELGFRGKIFVTDQIAERVLALRSDTVVEVASEAEVHAKADLFVFEAGASRDDDLTAPSGARSSAADGMRVLTQEEYYAFQFLHRAYVRAVDAERRAKRAARRFVLINMQSNPSETLVQSHIGASWTPIATHVRHGFVLPDPFAASSIDPIAWLSANMTGKWRLSRELLGDIARKIADGADAGSLSAYANVSSDLIGALQQPGSAEALRTAPDKLNALIEDLRRRRPSERLRKAGVPMADLASPGRGLSRIIAIEDFDDPDWGRCAVRAVGVKPVYEIGLRSRFAWVGAHLVYALESCGALDKTVMLLQHPADETKMAQLLSATIINWSAASAVYDSSRPFAGEPIFDAVVVSPRSAALAGSEHLPAVLTAVDQALKPGGVCVLVLDVVEGTPRKDAFGLRALQSKRFTCLSDYDVHWRLMGKPDATLSARTLDAAVFGDTDDTLAPVRIIGSDIHAPAILVYQKTAASSADAWKRFYAAYLGQPLATTAH